jgi:hypothetical protein
MLTMKYSLFSTTCNTCANQIATTCHLTVAKRKPRTLRTRRQQETLENREERISNREVSGFWSCSWFHVSQVELVASGTVENRASLSLPPFLAFLSSLLLTFFLITLSPFSLQHALVVALIVCCSRCCSCCCCFSLCCLCCRCSTSRLVIVLSGSSALIVFLLLRPTSIVTVTAELLCSHQLILDQ